MMFAVLQLALEMREHHLANIYTQADAELKGIREAGGDASLFQYVAPTQLLSNHSRYQSSHRFLAPPTPSRPP